jgi:hypothetical protein
MRQSTRSASGSAIRQSNSRRELMQLRGASPSAAATKTLDKVNGHGMAAYFIREHTFGRKERIYGVVVVTSKTVALGNIEIVMSAPLLG